MNPNLKASINLVFNVLAACSGVLIAAAQPADRWQWVQLFAGMVVAIAGVLRATWNETPGSAKP